MTNIRDLLGGATRAEIINLLGGNVVRILTVDGNNVTIDAGGDKITVPLDTRLTYVPWVLDRGNITFTCARGTLKFCTEADILRIEGRADASIIP
jgi:hypothetical protein